MFNLFNRPSAEAEARAYCQKIGADPDALVWGRNFGEPFQMPRWRWYVSQGAAERAPVISRGV